MRWLAIAVLLLGSRVAAAGPYCGGLVEAAPASESKVPVGATIALFQEDFYYQGGLKARARAPGARVTLDGKPVAYSVSDVRVHDGVVRYFKIKSRATGKLELEVANRWQKGTWDSVAIYTIEKDVSVPERVTGTVALGADTRLSPYRYVGQLGIVKVDAPAIGFTLKWRSNGKWATRAMPASIEAWPSTTKRSELRLGEVMCGMTENFSLATLRAGVEIELTATLVDGRQVRVDGLPQQVVLPPAPPAKRPD